MTELEALTASFPGWSIWRSRTDDGVGDWYATRRAYRLTPVEMDASVCMTVAAGTLEELRRALDEQTERQAERARAQ
jgi:hypothetical protein